MTEFCSESQQSDCFSLHSMKYCSKCHFHLFRHCKMSVSLALFAYALVGVVHKRHLHGRPSGTLCGRDIGALRTYATRQKRANTYENRAKISRKSPAKRAKRAKSDQNTVVFGNNAHFTHLSDILTRKILSGNT